MCRIIPPVVVLAPHYSNVVVYTEVCGLFSVFYMPKPNDGIHIEQEKHKLDSKLDQIAPRNLKMSLDKRIAFNKATASPEEIYTRTKFEICDKNLPTALANSSYRSWARRTI